MWGNNQSLKSRQPVIADNDSRLSAGNDVIDDEHFVIPEKPLFKSAKNEAVLESDCILPDLSSDEDDCDEEFSDSDSDTTIGFGSHVSFTSSREKAVGTSSLLLNLTKAPKPDDFIFCELCNEWQENVCLDHKPETIENDVEHELGLPDAFTIATSQINPHVDGVFAIQTIPTACFLGPIKGPLKYDNPATSTEKLDYLWEVKLFTGQSQYFMRDGEPQASTSDAAGPNWMYKVQMTNDYRRQNLMAVQFDGEIYYRTMRDVFLGEELAVFHGSGLGLMKDVVSMGDVVLPEGAPLRTKQCSHCPFRYTNTHDLSKHMRGPRHRPEDDVKCSSCGFVAQSRSKLREHMTKKHKTRPYKCIICPYHKGCMSSVALKTHMDKKHATPGLQKNHKCRHCPKTFSLKQHWRKHELTHSDVPGFACTMCDAEYKRDISLNNHMAKVHDIGVAYVAPRKQCPHCTFSCTAHGALKTHICVKHSKEPKPGPKEHDVKLYRCNFCSDVFTRQSAVPRHEYRKHPMEKAEAVAAKNAMSYVAGSTASHVCPMCQKCFKEASSLKYHMQRHTQNFDHICPQCSKGYPTGAELRKHIARTHQSS